jgi:hypothetical protein
MFGVAADSLLTPERLQMRFDIFRAIALPSVIAQRDAEFTWCIAVDPEMPASFRESLEQILDPFPHFHVVTLPFGSRLNELDWVAPFVHPETDFILSTLLDDDDGLSESYMSEVQTQALAQIQAGKPYGFAGAREGWQWDFLKSESGALGRVKPWTRRDIQGNPFFLSAGFSMWAPRSANQTVFMVGHNVAHVLPLLHQRPYIWVNWDWIWRLRTSLFPMVEGKRRFLMDVVRMLRTVRKVSGGAAASNRWRRRVATIFLDAEVVMSNHGDNTELLRMGEAEAKAVWLSGDVSEIHNTHVSTRFIRDAVWLKNTCSIPAQ